MPATTAQVARIANVSASTVRNYTREYADLLSPEARGEGGTRLFSDEDIQVFCAVADLRKSGVPPAEVIERVRRGDVVIDAAPQTTPHEATQTPQMAPDAPQAILISHNSLQRQIDALRLAQRRQLWSHGVAFYLGMVTMGILFYLVWLWVNGW